MLFYPIETLRDAGITDIGIIVGHTPQRIQDVKDAVGDGSRLGVRVTYIEQDAPRGIAHAIKTAQGFLTSDTHDKKFVVHLGDNILRGGIGRYVADFAGTGVDAFALFCHVPDVEKKLNTWGSPVIENGKLRKVIEKPVARTNDLAFVGIYGFNESFFDAYERLKLSPRNEYEIADTISVLIEKGKNVKHYVLDTQWWKDPGNPEGVLEANALLLDELEPFQRGTVEEGALVTGKVGIDVGSIVKKGAVIRGPSIIGANCLIAGNSRIGPYASIGNNTVVENTEVEDTIIIGDCVIYSRRKITHSLIGRNVRINSPDDANPEAVRLVVGENSIISI
jgi:glucose-1-phosphate thymidylyltransferase